MVPANVERRPRTMKALIGVINTLNGLRVTREHYLHDHNAWSGLWMVRGA